VKRDAKTEFERLRNILLNRYYERSIVDEAVTTRNYNPDTDNAKEFRQIGSSGKFESNPFSDSSHFLDLLFEQEADNIILGEKKYLVDTMLKQEIEPKFMDQFTYDNLLNVINLKFQTTEPSVIFMPLTLFSRIRMEWWKQPQRKLFEVQGGNHRLVLGGNRPKPQLIWSNKYMPFDSIVIASKRVGEWIGKPKLRERVRVTLSDDNKVLHAYSVFRFEIRNTQELLKIDVNPEELDKERLDKLTRTPVE